MFLTKVAKSLRIFADNRDELELLLTQLNDTQNFNSDIVEFRKFWIERLETSATTIKNLVLELCA